MEQTDPGRHAGACARLVESAPDQVDGLDRREVDGDYAAAWGDPPVVLRCGVAEPTGFDRFSSCHVTNGVAWFIPERQVTGAPVDVTMTTVGRSPDVEVTVPADYFPPAATMVDLADVVKRETDLVDRCG